MDQRFPIYIVSKGRAKSRLTSKALESMSIEYSIVVEEQEYDDYAAEISPHRILILDKRYQDTYDTCDDLDNIKSKGPGPARNFVWDHSITNGHSWHWVMDDNITRFLRFNNNKKIPVRSYGFFSAMQDFVLRFQNVAMAGPNYRGFISQGDNSRPPYLANTRIYSCNFIRNDTPFRWRCRYNEDTDLSLRMLKAGWCTLQFNAFLQEKLKTQTIGGGNTDDFYAKEGTLPKSQMLIKCHPDVARLTKKYGRWHHHVNYSRFKRNALLYRDDYVPTHEINNYGLTLKRLTTL